MNQQMVDDHWTHGKDVPYKAIFLGDIPLHSPYIGLIYGRYLHFRILKFPLTVAINFVSYKYRRLAGQSSELSNLQHGTSVYVSDMCCELCKQDRPAQGA